MSRFRLLALLGLTILTLLFFWKILGANLILSGVDVFLYFYPYKAYTAEALRQGRLPLWNPYLFMGAPLLANSQVGLFYPLNWFFIGLDAPKQVAWSIALHITLAGCFMGTLARQELGLSQPAALITALLFAFGGYLGAQVEHINQLQAAAWLPLLFLLYSLTLRRSPSWFWLLLLSLVIALIFLAGHTQTAFISLSGLGLYGLWEGIRRQGSKLRLGAPPEPVEGGAGEQGRNSILSPTPHVSRLTHPGSRFTLHVLRFTFYALLPLIIATLIAAALAAVQLLPTAELSSLSIRGEGLTYRQVVSFSLHPSLLHYTLLPPIGLDLTQILGEAFGEWIAYLGISGLALALLGGYAALWQPRARPFLLIAIAGLILSFGLYTGPLYAALYYLVPGFGLFRVPARWLLLYALGMSALAGFGFESLLTPETLRPYLVQSWNWLRGRAWRLLLFALPLLFFLIIILWRRPPVFTLLIWLVLAGFSLSLVIASLLSNRGVRIAIRTPQGFAQTAPLIILPLLLLVELFWAAQALNYNQPTAPQAYSSMRNAISFLLANDPPGDSQPPGRFLSLSGTTYDPGDLADLRQVYGDHLSEKGLYNLVVATKQKEVLFFNLPMLYGFHSVDGYDGGLLPLGQFITLQRLFLPADDLSLDGRLREKLRFVPPGRLLSLLNTRWIITDKQFDVWIDGIFYDLQFPAALQPGQTITTTDIPDFPPTALGLVSHLEGATTLLAETPVAEVRLTFADGSQQILVVKAGVDTAEGNYLVDAQIAHPQAKVGVSWPYEAEGVDYISVYPLQAAQTITRIEARATLPEGQFILRGLSLIHQPTTTSRSVLLTTEGDYHQVHSGDVKIYENRAALPRAFLVHQAETASDDEQAITRLQNPQFDPAQTLVLSSQSPLSLSNGGALPGPQTRGAPSTADQAAIISYDPERVEIRVNLASPGWLVLLDTYYPGWQATVDGQPAEITRANLHFRAVPVPEGEHTVLFEFKPRSVQIGAWITGITLLLVIAGLGLTRYLQG